MSWHYSQALEEAYSAASCGDGGQSVPSNGMPTHGTFWSPGKTTDALKPSRSGMTFRPSTDAHGEAVLMWCLAASPAKTSPPLAKVPESTASEAVCGNTWRESSAKYCRISSSWKTHRCLWEEDLEPSSLTLPQWGMMLNGVLWERITPPPLTNEIGSGCWVGTPTATMSVRSEEFAKGRLPQPAEFVRQWPTPRAGNPGSRPNGKGGKVLAEEVKKSVMWPTPTAQDAKNNGAPSQMERNTKPLNAEVGGALNPTWVEWLMGWPLGWTDCGASATDKFRQWCASHGEHF